MQAFNSCSQIWLNRCAQIAFFNSVLTTQIGCTRIRILQFTRVLARVNTVVLFRLVLFLLKMKWLCSTMYVKKLFRTVVLQLVYHSFSFFFFFFFFGLYDFFHLQKNAIEMKIKSRFSFQSEWFSPSANFVKFKVLKYLGIKVLASALCSALVL